MNKIYYLHIQPILDDFNNKLKTFDIKLVDDEIYARKWYKSALRALVKYKGYIEDYDNYSERREASEIKKIDSFLLKLAKNTNILK